MSRVVSAAEARRYLLAYHFLLRPRSLRPGTGVLKVMDRLRCIQIDPLDTVGRNVHLVMQSRVKGYHPPLLDSLIYHKHLLVEAWDKMRSVVRVDDWPSLDRFRKRMRDHYAETAQPPQEIVDYVREEIAARGMISSIDLKDKGSAEWRWAPPRLARAALDLMFDWGEIAVVGRVGPRKLYSMMSDVLPPEVARAEDPHPDHASYVRWHVERRIRSLGLAAARAGAGWLGIQGASARDRSRALAELEDAGRLMRVEMDDHKTPYFVPADSAQSFKPDAAGSRRTTDSPCASFIAPLDNLMWDRRLIRDLFGFHYTWEVYKPASKREYGYYVLPVLYGDTFIARWEPRRETDAVVVRGWWWEHPAGECRDNPDTQAAIGEALRAFMEYVGVKRLRFERPVRAEDRKFLRAALVASPPGREQPSGVPVD
ncbi:MAG: crosslink repair DNA glycosylase YcaQ family protein [Spirochaetia bacterium]